MRIATLIRTGATLCATSLLGLSASAQTSDSTVRTTITDDHYVADEVAAIVGNSQILMSDIDRTTEEVLHQRQQYGQLSNRPAREEAFETLLLQKLLAEQARADSLDKDLGSLDDQVEQQIQQMVDEVGSVKALEKKFGKEIFSIKDDLKHEAEDMQLASLMQSKVMDKISVTYPEVAEFFNTLPLDSLEMVPAQYTYAQIVRFPPETEERKFEVRQRLLEFRERILKGESLGLHPRNPGQRMVYSFYVPPEHYPSDGNGPVYLQILSRDGGYVSHGTVMHCREPETFRLEGEPLGTYTFKWLESYISEDGGDRYTITDYEKVRFEGMRPVFYGGRTNALPMDRWKATSHYLWGKKESFECEKATLYLLNDYDRFEIGYETMYERQHCRAFDLETFLDDSPLAYTGFRLAEETEVSPDGRYQRRKGEGGLFYQASRDLLFPPVEGNVPSTYEFVLVLEGADIGGGMEYVYPFTYVKETNYVGPCASSDYCVAEVD